MTGYDMVQFFRKNGMQNGKAISFNKDTSTVHETERKKISFSSQRLKTILIYSICLILKRYLEIKKKQF